MRKTFVSLIALAVLAIFVCAPLVAAPDHASFHPAELTMHAAAAHNVAVVELAIVPLVPERVTLEGRQTAYVTARRFNHDGHGRTLGWRAYERTTAPLRT